MTAQGQVSMLVKALENDLAGVYDAPPDLNWRAAQNTFGISPEMAHQAIVAGWSEARVLDIHQMCIVASRRVLAVREDIIFVDGWGLLYKDDNEPTRLDHLVHAPKAPAPLEDTWSREERTNTMVWVYTDGSGTTASQPAGVGVVLITNIGGLKAFGLGAGIGPGTNNRAELMAIRRGLQLLPRNSTPIDIVSDSAYAIGCCTERSWNPTKNEELIKVIRNDLTFRGGMIKFVKVKGHSTDPWNGLADRLAHSGRTGEPLVLPKKLEQWLLGNNVELTVRLESEEK